MRLALHGSADFFGLQEEEEEGGDQGSGGSEAGLRINKKFAGKYEERKRREELQHQKEAEVKWGMVKPMSSGNLRHTTTRI